MREPKTVLLIWNPNKWEWESLDDMVEETARSGSCLDQWSVGRSRDIAPGDRFYLMHLGAEPRGIMASGWIMSEPESKPHWDGSERSTLYVDIEYDRLFKPESCILPLAQLRELGPSQHWTPQTSGTFVKEELVGKVEEAWNSVSPSSTAEPATQFIEGTAFTVRMTRFERDPRNRSACIAHHGMKCAVCGFDFQARYGLLGAGFIHVHHLNPLSSTKKAHRIDPVHDLRPVCPNCHAMLHRRKDVLSIEELKALIK
ncbi:MAG: HNH endonuclease [Bacteroidetes bacterium]|nr:HNH endonuclease [Bacteroidota bacterium]MBS1939469.1 HNH endonuclease [Bacteroidota bacterium]